MTQFYKWMLPGLATPTQNKPWPVGVGEWTPDERPILCESGWHGMGEQDVLTHLPYQVGVQLWVVERRGEVVEGDDKFCAESMRLTYHVGTTDERNLRLFAADCAEDVLHLYEDKYPKDDRPRRAIEAARAYARGDIGASAWAAVRDAVRDAAWAAAGDAAWDAAGAAAWAAAWDAAWTAVRDAAWAAAGDAAWDEARARYSNWLVYRLWGGEGDEE